MGKDKETIDITLPTTWASLTDKQLRYVFTVVAAGFTTAEVKTYCLCRWGGVKVLHPYGDDFACRVGKREVVLTVETIERATHSLDWLDEPSPVPVRLERIGRHCASAVHSVCLREHRQRLNRTQQHAPHTPCQDNLHGDAPQD